MSYVILVIVGALLFGALIGCLVPNGDSGDDLLLLDDLSSLPNLNFTIYTKTLGTRLRMLKAVWSLQTIEDFMAPYVDDAEVAIVKEMAQALNTEIINELIALIPYGDLNVVVGPYYNLNRPGSWAVVRYEDGRREVVEA